MADLLRETCLVCKRLECIHEEFSISMYMGFMEIHPPNNKLR